MTATLIGDTRPTPPSGLHQVPLTHSGDSGDGEEVELSIGQRLGPFELRQLLGAGGMGQVYLADQLQPVERQVALKFMRYRLADGAALVRFEIERQALARMSHPAIAQVFEAGTTADGYPYLAMEFVPGEPIDDYCRRCRLGLTQRLELFIRAALGVAHAHQKGILHLDLKPANLLVTEVDGAPQPKIIDFGLAISAVRTPRQRSGMTLAGTPGYMSPEQAGIDVDGTPCDVDIRSDVYALGVVLYQLLTDSSPYVPGQFGDSTTVQLRRHFEVFVVPLASARLAELGEPRSAARVRGDLDAVVTRAMQISRTARYDSVGELIEDLRRFLERRPVRARPPTRGHRLRLYLARNRLPFTVAAVLTLSLIGGLAAATYGLLQARAERDIAATRQRELERVSEFQQAMLSGLDPAILGQNLQQSLRTQLVAALKTQADGAPRLAAFDRDLALANPTEAARQLLDAELLDRAVQAIDREFGEQPLVAAELGLSISKAYLALGRFETALRVGAAALEKFRGELGEIHLETLQARVARSQVLKQLGRGREDLPALERLIGDADQAGAAAVGISLAAQLLRVEIIGLEAGQLADSVAIARELVARHQQHFGATALETIQATQILAILLGRNGELEAATPLWRQTLEQTQSQFGDEDPHTLAVLDSLGANLAMQGANAEALPLHLRALELRRKVQGNEHPQTLQSMNSASITLSRLDRLPEAIDMAAAALELRQRTLGPDHPMTLRSMLNLGAFHATNGDVGRAAELTRECYERRLATLGPDNPDVYTAALNLADFEIILGHPAAALKLAEQTLHERERLLGPDHREVAVAQRLYARALVAAGENAAAIPLIERELAESRDDPDANLRARSMAAWYLARAYAGVGRKAESQALIDHDLQGLLDATWKELNPPERFAVEQVRAQRH
jgi:non-specific serine/threonine protein kinase/serine/threonine-protein kinase